MLFRTTKYNSDLIIVRVISLLGILLLSHEEHQKHISAFDALRGLAALLVVIAHIPNIKQPSLGASGVWLFFVLSGFLLYWFFEKKDIKTLILTTPNYFWRRFFRLIPAYFFCVTIYAIAYSIFYKSNMLTWLVEHFLFLKAVGHFWSIKIELIFYLMLPISLLVIAISNNFFYKSIVSLAMIFLFYYVFEYKAFFRVDAASIQLAPYLSPFYLGIFLSLIRNKLPTYCFNYFFYIGFLGVLFLSLDFDWLLSSRSFLPYEEVDNIGWRYPYLIYPFAGLTVLGSYKAETKILKNKVILSLGICAYSFYLWHILPINALKLFTDNPTISFLVTIIVSYFLGTLTYSWIERPAIDFSKKYQLQVVKKGNLP